MDMIDKILESAIFADNPPVLLDVGASGEIHPKWKPLARHAICIAFDADEREIGYAVDESREYRKLYLFNSLVTDAATAMADFYLTRSPFCSSLLVPDDASLANYNFGDLFAIEKIVRLNSVQLSQALRKVGVTKVDWFKTDSQGTDLRLFASLGEELVNRVLVAEFEPGIVDGYRGEDKLHGLMAFMDKCPFWMSNMKVCGTQRISQSALARQFPGYNGKPVGGLPLRTAPCWAEVSYFNAFGIDAGYLDLRDYLLGWIFAVLEEQYGFALDIALQGKERFRERVFDILVQYATERIMRG